MDKEIELTKEELGAFGILETKVREIEVILQEAAKARMAYIKLLELKYSAKLDIETGFFIPNNGKSTEVAISTTKEGQS